MIFENHLPAKSCRLLEDFSSFYLCFFFSFFFLWTPEMSGSVRRKACFIPPSTFPSSLFSPVNKFPANLDVNSSRLKRFPFFDYPQPNGTLTFPLFFISHPSYFSQRHAPVTHRTKHSSEIMPPFFVSLCPRTPFNCMSPLRLFGFFLSRNIGQLNIEGTPQQSPPFALFFFLFPHQCVSS